MIKQVFLSLFLLANIPAATAQSNCAKPAMKLFRNGMEIPAAASALAPSVTLRVVPEAGCPAGSYRFRHAQISLVRNGPVLPTLLVEKTQADLRPFLDFYQSGDQLVVFVAYQNIALEGTDGSLLPLVPARSAKPKPGQLDLQTEESKGISFRWPLVKQD